MFKYQISRKSVQWKPSFFRADRRKNMTKLTVAFRSVVKAPTSVKLQLHATSLNMVTSNYIHLLET